MKMIKVTPCESYKILHPDTNHTIPPEGEIVEFNHYWLRRQLEGGVVISPAEQEKENPAEMLGNKNKEKV